MTNFEMQYNKVHWHIHTCTVITCYYYYYYSFISEKETPVSSFILALQLKGSLVVSATG